MFRARRRGWRLFAVLTVLTLVTAAMPMAGAAPDHKSFEATISPAEALAGTSTDFEVTVKNTSDNVKLGAVRITVPDGFVFEGITAVDPSNWNVDGNQVTAPSPSQGLAPGESLVMTVAARTALQEGGDTEYEFGIEARQANHFNGARNDLNFVGDPLTLLVTGSAVACTSTSCATSFSEETTDAEVEVPCEETDCGILVLDLDTDYCNGNACGGKGVFWNPPANPGGRVLLTLVIPQSEFDEGEIGISSYGSYEDGYDEDLPQFFYSKDDMTFEECELDEDDVDYYESETPAECEFQVFEEGDDFVFEINIDPVDPRGFAS